MSIPVLFKQHFQIAYVVRNLDAARARLAREFGIIEWDVMDMTALMGPGHATRFIGNSFVGDMMSKVPTEVTDAIRDGRPVPDAKLETLREFAHVMTESRGNPTPAQAQAFLAAGYTEEHILGIILAISVKVISNYSNHIFHTELDAGFAGRAWSAAA